MCKRCSRWAEYLMIWKMWFRRAKKKNYVRMITKTYKSIRVHFDAYTTTMHGIGAFWIRYFCCILFIFEPIDSHIDSTQPCLLLFEYCWRVPYTGQTMSNSCMILCHIYSRSVFILLAVVVDIFIVNRQITQSN